MGQCIIIRKVKSDILVLEKVAINSELLHITMTYTYENALVYYRKLINQSTRTDMGATNHTARNIN